MNIDAKLVKSLRDKTGAGMMNCRKALQESEGDLEKAVDWLRKQGIAKAAKRSSRSASEGIVSSYVHLGGKIGVIVEVNCETDFVARTDEFQLLAKDIAMHIAATNPDVVSREEVPAETVNKEKEIYREQAAQSGKPEKVLDKIVEGRLDKYYQEICLLEQAFVKNPDVSVKQLIEEATAKIGEKIQVRRFARYQLGQ